MAGSKLTKAGAAWEAACRAWSRDDCTDMGRTMNAGEAMMFAATDYICALEELRDKGRTLSDMLNAYGFPVSEAAWKNSSGGMSIQARGLHLAAASYRALLTDTQQGAEDA